MKNKIAMVSLVLGVGFTQFACGLSPLFHHSNPVRENLNQDPNSNATVVSSNCDFYFATQNLCASLSWLAQDEDGYREFALVFWDKNSGSHNGPYHIPQAQTVAVKLWMPAHGHGSSPVRVSELKNEDGVILPGQYLASQVYFSMPGEWQIIVQLKNDKDVIDAAEINYFVN